MEPRVWSPEEIRKLRLRMGWSRAEMGHRLGCSFQIVSSWEDGKNYPDHEVLNQLNHMWAGVEAYAERLSQSPLAETLMNQKNLSQITQEDLNNSLSDLL